MDAPKIQNRFCPYCRKHTEHEVKRVSVRKIKRMLASGQRRFKRKMRGYGSFPKTNPRDRAKPTRKLDISYICKECKRAHNIGKGFRVKKFELVKV